MTLSQKLSRLLPSGLVLALALAGCLDFTPINVAPTEAGIDEAATVTPDVNVDIDGGACELCVQGPSCSAVLATCEATDKCLDMFKCGLSRGCYAPGANLVGCLTVCGQQAGLTGQEDPAVAPFLGLYECATTKCATACAN